MPSPLRLRHNMSRFFGWIGRTAETPAGLQRLGIIGAGLVMWPTMIGFALVVWRGFDRTPELQSQALHFMGVALLACLALWGLVVVALVGIVKGVRVSAPGGVGVSIQTTADDPDVAPSTTRDEDGFGARRDYRGGRTMPQISS